MPYLNHAGTSWPKPEPVRTAVQAAFSSDPGTWSAAFERDHRAVATFLGVSDPERLLLTPGCTSALSVAVADHNWEAGDRVLCSGLEHHALHRALTQLQARGVSLEVLGPSPAPRDPGPVDLEQLERALAAGGVRLVALTAACNVTGELLPLPAVLERARAHRALVLVDAAQVAGWMPLEQAAAGADLIAFAGHKGPQAPWGIGGLIAAPGVELASPGATCELPQPGQPAACSTLPGYCDVGSVDRAALAGLAAGLAWLEAPERRDRLRAARDGIERLVAAALALDGVRLHGPRDPQLRMPTAAFTLEGRDPGELARALAARDVQASAGLQCAPLAHRTLGTAPAGALRFSAGPTTSTTDIDAAIAALESLA